MAKFNGPELQAQASNPTVVIFLFLSKRGEHYGQRGTFKKGTFSGYAWEKDLNESYEKFLKEFENDLKEQLEHQDDPLYQHYHSQDEAGKSLINLTLFVTLVNPILKTTTLAVNTPKVIKWVYGAFKSSAKWASQLAKRGWTPDLINEAITSGKSFKAVNMVNAGNGATRYVHPITGQSVIIDDVTHELLHVGGPGYKY